MAEKEKNEYVALRQSIKALKAEIDKAYDEHAGKGNSVMVEGVGQHSPKAFSFMCKDTILANKSGPLR